MVSSSFSSYLSLFLSSDEALSEDYLKEDISSRVLESFSSVSLRVLLSLAYFFLNSTSSSSRFCSLDLSFWDY